MLICINITADFLKTWGPFIILFVGYFLTIAKARSDKRKEIVAYRDLFISWVKIAKNRTLKQVSACEEFSVAALASENIDREGITFSPLLYGKLNSISLEKSISAFVFNSSGDNEKNLKEYNSIIVHINFFDAMELEIRSAYNEYSQEMSKLNEQFNNLFITIERTFFTKDNEVGNNHNDPNFAYIQFLGEIRNNWRNNIPNGGNSSAIHTFNNLINPSIEYVHEKYNLNRGNKFLMEMYDQLDGMRIVERFWLDNKKGFSERIQNYGNQIKEAYEGLEKTMEYFETRTEIVGIWEIK